VDMIQPFYNALATGLPVADAVRTAKLAALRRGLPAREWASLLTVGDPLVRIPLHQSPSSWWSWTAGLVGAATLVLALVSKSRLMARRA
jgi:hypothetical protein